LNYQYTLFKKKGPEDEKGDGIRRG
jgi:hypothetical protein